MGPYLVMVEYGKARHDWFEQEQEQYSTGPWPIGVLAHRLGLDVIDVAGGLASQGISLKVALGNQTERDAVARAIRDNARKGCVLDALLTRRIWRAHLRSLFPWIEEVRQKVIARYDRRLTIDHFQRDLGAKTVEDIEFGGIVKQLISAVQPREGDFLRAMWNMRNDLAHRKPAAGSDLKQALDLAGILGFAEQF